MLTAALFTGTFQSYVPVTLTSDRAGLVMESGAKVKMRGVQVGRVAAITGGSRPRQPASSRSIPTRSAYIPANVQAQIRATTVFGAKYVDLIYPERPQPRSGCRPAQVLKSRNVSTEVNTVFQNLVGRAAPDRPGQAERGADRAGRGCARARGSASVRPPPTPTRCCWRSIRASTRSAQTGAR